MKTTDFINKFTEDAEYDDEAGMAKNSLHTIIRVATHLERALADDENLPEWVQEKIGAIKGMMVSVMDYVISQHEMGKQPHVPTFDADAVMESFESMINEAAIKPEQLAQLNQLKRSMQQQAMTPRAVDADTQAEIDAWERDFAATHGSRTFAQDNPATEPEDDDEDWRTRSRDSRKKLRAQRIKADQLISMGEKMLALIDRSEKFPGGIPPGLRSDLENLEVAFDEQNPDYDTLIDLYTKRLGQLQDFVSMKRAVYRKSKTPRYNEGAPIATTPDSIDPGGATDNFKQQMANNTEVAYQKKLAGVSEEWSKKYKSSINCSHPKGFSQKAHCAGKKKHNESHEVMEDTCPDCGMCETHGDHSKDKLDELKCWSGYHRVAGTKAGFPGSCEKNKTNEESVEEEKCPHCNGPMFSEMMMNEKKDACYYKVKSRYKVWPSAYASGALVKCRKKGAANWGTKNESADVDQLEENLHDWFHKEKWVRFGPDGKIRGDCARDNNSEGKPKCLPASKAHALGQKGRASAAARKRKQDPNPERRGAAHNVATKTNEASKDCPPATQDIKLNLKNRQKAIDDYGYGPLNPALPNRKFWMAKVEEWNLDSDEEAKQSLCGNCAAFDQREDTLDCIAQGIGSEQGAEDPTIEAGDLGYCRFLKFKCASLRTCDAWVTGGPLVDKQDVTESEDYSPVAQAITRRIMLQRTDLLSKFGPERVSDAIDEVADFVGDVEEIGTSDVSGWVRQVERNLGDYQLDESIYSVYEDATGGSSSSSSMAIVVGELGEGGMTRKQVNKKLGGYTNVQTKGGKIRVKGSY
jgi:hypothetical protein